MASWLIYLKERFPLPVYILLVGGITLSGDLMATGEIAWPVFFWVFSGIMLFFALLRLMDELKDFEKDVIVHPTRPLPRGLLKRATVTRVIRGLAIAMIVFSLAVGGFVNPVAGALYGLVTLWLWLMYREFFLGSWLADRPILYAITHQLILLPLCAFAVVAHDAALISHAMTWYYAVCVLGSFFSYEVCRKLDRSAHPLLKSYLAVHGPLKVMVLVAVLNALAGSAAWRLALGPLLWPAELLTALSLAVLFLRPAKYKWAEGAATLSLLLHIWGVSLSFAYYFFLV